MDLLSGLVTANAPISQQNGVGSFIEGNTAGQAATKARIENENAQYQQDLTTRMQKAISNSVNPDGSINFKLLAKNGAAEGIAPQMQKQMADILTQQWDSIAKTAQSKMQLRQQAPQGYQQLQTEVNQDNQTGELPWSQRPASAGGQGATQSSSRAVAVPSEPVSSPSPSEDNSGETAKNYAYLTPDEKYTSSRPIKNVNGQIVNGGSQAELAADNSGFTTPDMLQANQTTTGGSGVSEGAGQVNVTGSQLNPNAIQNDSLSPDTSTETAPDVGANYGQAPQGQPAQQNAPVAQAQQTGTESSNPYDIANKMDVRNPAAGLGGAQGADGKIPGVDDYTIPQNTYTGADGKIHAYTAEELARNPQLDVARSAENYFRSRTGDSKSDINTVARNYLRTQYENTLKTEGTPAEPIYPVSGDLKALDEYNKAHQEWVNKNSQAIGKAQAAVQTVKDAVAKGQFDLADKLIDNQKTTIKLGQKEYRAYDAKGRDGVASLVAVEPVAKAVEGQLKTLKDGDYTSLQLLIPQAARVMAMRLNPGSDVSMGSIAEAQATTNMEDAQHMGLSVGGALAALAEWMSNPDKSFHDIAKNYLAGAVGNASVSGIAGKVSNLLEESGKSAEEYKKANLIGYSGPGDTNGSNPKGTPASDSSAPLTSFPKTGWYDQPYNKDQRLGFTSASGKKYEVDQPGTDAFGGQKPYTSAHDATGKSYTLQPSTSGGIDIIDPNGGTTAPTDRAPKAAKGGWANRPARPSAPARPAPAAPAGASRNRLPGETMSAWRKRLGGK